MSKQGNRWLIQIVLLLAVAAFIGVSIIPILGTLNAPRPQNSPENPQLADQIRGYELVLQREPENQAVLKQLLQARLQILSQKPNNEVQPTDIQGVIETLQKLSRLNPDNLEYKVLLAQANQQIGNAQEAIQIYRSILRTQPGNIQSLQGIVKLELDQKRPEAAIQFLKQTISNAEKSNSVQPGSFDIIAIQLLLGSVYSSQKNTDQAISLYEGVMKQYPQDFRPVLAKAILLKEQGKINEAKPLFNSALTLAPAQYKDEIKNLTSGF